MRYLPLLLLLACGTDPASPTPDRTCLAAVQYRYVVAEDTFSTGGSSRAVGGGPLCIEFTGDRALITNGATVTLDLDVSAGGSVQWYLWPPNTRAEAQVSEQAGRLILSPISGELYWLLLPDLVITETPEGLLMTYVDVDEVLRAEWRR